MRAGRERVRLVGGEREKKNTSASCLKVPPGLDLVLPRAVAAPGRVGDPRELIRRHLREGIVVDDGSVPADSLRMK